MIHDKTKLSLNSSSPINTLKGIGPKTSKSLAQLQLNTIEDLLFHLPRRYQNRTTIIPINKININDEALIEGTITARKQLNTKRPNIIFSLNDNSGTINIKFFIQHRGWQPKLSVGQTIRCFGRVINNYYGQLEMVHPDLMDKVSNNSQQDCLSPVYPTTAGVSQKLLRKLNQQALQLLQQHPMDFEYIHDEIQTQFNLVSLTETLIKLHQPKVNQFNDQDQLRQRLAFEELLAHALRQIEIQSSLLQQQASSIPWQKDLLNSFLDQLPFTLTADQQTASQDILSDLTLTSPMWRLLQGDVGSGKTIVAAIAALNAINQGFQVALMAPTELLVEQHFNSFKQWLTPYGIKVFNITNRTSKAAKEQALLFIANGNPCLVIGTHALLSQPVIFNGLSLVIVDEQHRFGVTQRTLLWQKGITQASSNLSSQLVPHRLFLTATPIPRTLAMSLYADLKVSSLSYLPPGRKQVITLLKSASKRDSVIPSVQQACQQGQQVYWVCPFIDASEQINGQSAITTANYLQQLLPNVNCAVIHGQLNQQEQHSIIAQFKTGEIQLLVATTIIEVGIDVPNASIIIIENSERMGLAQLHQLRGRVGRGSRQSYCILLYQTPLTEIAKERLTALRNHHDGFKIAETDLKVRGPGEYFGTRQAGALAFRVADLYRDQPLLQNIKQAAQLIYDKHPQQAQALMRRWLTPQK